MQRFSLFSRWLPPSSDVSFHLWKRFYNATELHSKHFLLHKRKACYAMWNRQSKRVSFRCAQLPFQVVQFKPGSHLIRFIKWVRIFNINRLLSPRRSCKEDHPWLHILVKQTSSSIWLAKGRCFEEHFWTEILCNDVYLCCCERWEWAHINSMQ